MAITREELHKKREMILEIARRHGANDLRLFGSVARGDATDASDVDVLVHFDSDRTLLDHAALIDDLQKLLGMSVDVIDADGMRPSFKAVVEKQAVSL